jgi:hypothetical protein
MIFYPADCAAFSILTHNFDRQYLEENIVPNAGSTAGIHRERGTRGAGAAAKRLNPHSPGRSDMTDALYRGEGKRSRMVDPSRVGSATALPAASRPTRS